MSRKTNINVGYIARVEGQGELDIRVEDGVVRHARFAVFEPPKFYESWLVGRSCSELHELTSRICGICPIPHQITALRSVEDAEGIEVSDQTRDLRKLLMYSNHIMSHTLSVYILSAPDFLGYESIIPMVGKHLDLIKRALKMKKTGNDISELIGGRAVHPVSAIVKGFTSIPTEAELEATKRRLQEIKNDAYETIKLTSQLPFPDFERDCEHLAISDPKEYALNEGKLNSNRGFMVDEKEYRNYVSEGQLDYSWTKISTVKGRDSFLSGPLARVNLNFKQLTDETKKAAEEAGFKPPCYNPFKSIIARALEIYNAITDSIAIIDRLKPDPNDAVIEESFTKRAGEGFAITEAPRGLLYHNYKMDEKGIVQKADIVTPTAHNARNIERDLETLLPEVKGLPLEEATLKCEMLVRSYDPCISCSVHVTRIDSKDNRVILRRRLC